VRRTNRQSDWQERNAEEAVSMRRIAQPTPHAAE